MIDEIVLETPQVTTVTTDVRKIRIIDYKITGETVSITLCRINVSDAVVPSSLRTYRLSPDEFTDFMNNTVKQLHVGMERGNYIKQSIRLYVKNKLQI